MNAGRYRSCCLCPAEPWLFKRRISQTQKINQKWKYPIDLMRYRKQA